MEREYRVYSGKKKRGVVKSLTTSERDALLDNGCFVVVATEDRCDDMLKMDQQNKTSKYEDYVIKDYPVVYGIGQYLNVGFDGKVRARNFAS